MREKPFAMRYKSGLTDAIYRLDHDYVAHILNQCTITEIGGQPERGKVTWLYAGEYVQQLRAENEQLRRDAERYRARKWVYQTPNFDEQADEIVRVWREWKSKQEQKNE